MEDKNFVDWFEHNYDVNIDVLTPDDFKKYLKALEERNNNEPNNDCFD